MLLSQFAARVKPNSGDSSVIERVTGNTLTNSGTGTVSVVDRGSGDMAIRVSGGTMLLALPTSLGLINLSVGSGDLGCAFIARAKISTLDGANTSTQAIAQCGSTAANDTGVGMLRYGSAGQGFARGNWGTQGSNSADTGLSMTTERTIVLRMLPNNAADSGFDTFDTWITGGSGSGNSPDFPVTSGGKSGLTLSHFVSNPLGSNVFDISDMMVHRPTSGANLTDAQCRSVIALGIDAAIAADQISAALNTSLADLVASITAGPGIQAALDAVLADLSGNIMAGATQGRLTSVLPLRDAARAVLANRSDVVVHVLGFPGIASVARFTAQSITSGLWTNTGPFTPGLPYVLLYEVGGTRIGCEIAVAAAP